MAALIGGPANADGVGLRGIPSTAGPRATILLVEDEPVVAGAITSVLEAGRYRVCHAQDAAAAKAMLEEVRPDLIILDLMLPDADGLVLCVDLRERTQAPIIICSGTQRRRDPVLGMKIGADDFVAKPFDLEDLEARVEAALRRWGRYRAPEPAHPPIQPEPAPSQDQHELGELRVDHAHRRATLGGVALGLTPTEYRLLLELVRRRGEVVPREELVRLVWGHRDAGIDRALAVHISRLRAKLEQTAAAAPRLLTLRGCGYMLTCGAGGDAPAWA
jgi:DNA-binding response OmpR family regulator